MAKTKAKVDSGMAEAVKLLSQVEALNSEIEELMEEHGITAMLNDVKNLKDAAVKIAVDNGLERVDMPDGTYYGLRRDAYNKQIIGDAEELAAVKDPTAAVPLKSILKAKFGGKAWLEVWRSVTTRKVDANKLARAVSAGVLTMDEIQPAYYQDTKSPYLRKY